MHMPLFAKKGNYSVCRCGCLLGDKGMCGRRLFFVLHFLHGGEHVLNVVVFFHSLEEFFYCCATFGIKFLGVGWVVNELGAGDFEVVVFEILLNVAVRLKSTGDDDFLFVLVEILCAAVDKFEFEVFEGHTFFSLNVEVALVGEHKCH